MKLYCFIVGITIFSMGYTKSNSIFFLPIEEIYYDSQSIELARAAGKGDIKKIEQLVAAGADVNAQGKRGAPILLWPFKKKNIKGFKKLLELGADPNVLFNNEHPYIETSMLHSVAGSRVNAVFLKALLEHNGDPNLLTTNSYPESPLLRTVSDTTPDKFEKAEMLVKAGADINRRTPVNEKSPLLHAISGGFYKLALFLLELGADYTLRDSRGNGMSELLYNRAKGSVYKSREDIYWMKKIIVWLEERGVTVKKICWEKSSYQRDLSCDT